MNSQDHVAISIRRIKLEVPSLDTDLPLLCEGKLPPLLILLRFNIIIIQIKQVLSSNPISFLYETKMEEFEPLLPPSQHARTLSSTKWPSFREDPDDHIPSLDISSTPVPDSERLQSHSSMESFFLNQTATNSEFKDEKLFLLDIACSQILMVRFRAISSQPTTPLISPGSSSVILTSCRHCSKKRIARTGAHEEPRTYMRELFRTLSISPSMIRQMRVYEIMQSVAGNMVLILGHEAGVAFEEWELIFQDLPGDSIVSGIYTGMEKDPLKDSMVMPYVSAAFM